MIESIKYTSADPHHRLGSVSPDEDEEYKRRRAKRLQKSIKTQPELENLNLSTQPTATGFIPIQSVTELIEEESKETEENT